MSKLLPSILAVLTAAVGSYADVIQAYISAHPTIALVVGAIGVIIGNITKSPTHQ